MIVFAIGRILAAVILGMTFGGATVIDDEESDRLSLSGSVTPIGEPEVDVTEDNPGWYTVARLRYANGSQYDLVFSEFCTPQEREVVFGAIPEFAIFLGARETETSGDLCEQEITASWWVEE